MNGNNNERNGVNDAMLGRTIGKAAVDLANSYAGKGKPIELQRHYEALKQKQAVIEELDAANNENIKNGRLWKERALEAEEQLAKTQYDLRKVYETSQEELSKVRNQSRNRLIELMETSCAFNKSEAMRSALRDRIDALFKEGHVAYDKVRFDAEVNDDYALKRLDLGKVKWTP